MHIRRIKKADDRFYSIEIWPGIMSSDAAKSSLISRNQATLLMDDIDRCLNRRFARNFYHRA